MLATTTKQVSSPVWASCSPNRRASTPHLVTEHGRGTAFAALCCSSRSLRRREAVDPVIGPGGFSGTRHVRPREKTATEFLSVAREPSGTEKPGETRLGEEGWTQTHEDFDGRVKWLLLGTPRYTALWPIVWDVGFTERT